MRYAAMADSVAVAGEGVERVILSGRDVQCVAAGPDPARAFVGTTEGLHRTTDAGDTVDRVLEGHVTAVAVSPHDPDEVWAGTEPSRVFRSTDGGRTFVHLDGLTDLPSSDGWAFPPRPHTHHIRWLQADGGDPKRWYAAIEAGALVRTPDAGATWMDRVPGGPQDTHGMAVHADAPGRLYSAAGDGYFESTDGGETWERRQEGLDHRYCWSVAVAPGDPDHRLLSAATGPGSAHSPPGEGYVYRRTGNAWERVDGLPTGRGVYRQVLAAAAEFWALSNRGLYRSADGRRWEQVPLPWRERFGDQAPSGLAVV